MSPGDEPTQNVRVESRLSRAAMTWWPLALRYSAETMIRDQLWEMGIFTPRLPVFGAAGSAKYPKHGISVLHPGRPVGS